MTDTHATASDSNPAGLLGIAFVTFAGPDPDYFDDLFRRFGFSRVGRHRATADLVHYRQNQIHFLLDRQPGGFADRFQKAHGPSIPAMGWAVEDPRAALAAATSRGARAYDGPNPFTGATAIWGIGDSLIFFVEASERRTFLDDFDPLEHPVEVPDCGFITIDHLTNNVEQGQKEVWADFYKRVFGFTEVRTFHIKGEKTGLTSYALRSPDGSFCIPINEATDDKSQIAEYLRDYRGAGIQHLALLTNDLLDSLDRLQGSGIETLDIDDDYYETVFDRVPNVTEDRERIRRHRVLVDGDDEGYLLQIFTRNIIGPIFFEMIQRKNHHSFGEGNFGALFRSIERDQERRGVL